MGNLEANISEGLLNKNAVESPKGAGQYFNPRPLIRAIVDAVAPQPGEQICDPACGTGGFLLAAHDYIVANNEHLTSAEKKKLKENTFKGCELVQGVARLCAMNMLLHGIGSPEYEPVVVSDSLAADPQERFQLVLTNPPFGKKSSVTIVGEDGRAAVVVPDNVLFEGGAGETIRQRLLAECDVHTLLRLPTGLFYAQGVKANVLFFDKKPASEEPWTRKLWIYDLRTNMHFTLKTNPLQRSDLDDFVKCYKTDARARRKDTWSADLKELSPGQTEYKGRWRGFTYDEIVARDKASLDIFWLRDESLQDSDNLPEPGVIAQEIVADLEAALVQFKEIAMDLGVEDSE